MSSITFFSAAPLTVQKNKELVLKSTSVANGTLVYEIKGTGVTFHNGANKIEETVAAYISSTTKTSLNGNPSFVEITSRLKTENDHKSRTVELTN